MRIHTSIHERRLSRRPSLAAGTARLSLPGALVGPRPPLLHLCPQDLPQDSDAGTVGSAGRQRSSPQGKANPPLIRLLSAYRFVSLIDEEKLGKAKASPRAQSHGRRSRAWSLSVRGGSRTRTPRSVKQGLHARARALATEALGQELSWGRYLQTPLRQAAGAGWPRSLAALRGAGVEELPSEGPERSLHSADAHSTPARGQAPMRGPRDWTWAGSRGRLHGPSARTRRGRLTKRKCWCRRRRPRTRCCGGPHPARPLGPRARRLAAPPAQLCPRAPETPAAAPQRPCDRPFAWRLPGRSAPLLDPTLAGSAGKGSRR